MSCYHIILPILGKIENHILSSIYYRKKLFVLNVRWLIRNTMETRNVHTIANFKFVYECMFSVLSGSPHPPRFHRVGFHVKSSPHNIIMRVYLAAPRVICVRAASVELLCEICAPTLAMSIRKQDLCTIHVNKMC